MKVIPETRCGTKFDIYVFIFISSHGAFNIIFFNSLLLRFNLYGQITVQIIVIFCACFLVFCFMMKKTG